MWSDTTWRMICAERAIGHNPLAVCCFTCGRCVGQAKEFEGLEGFPFNIEIECAACVEDREQNSTARF